MHAQRCFGDVHVVPVHIQQRQQQRKSPSCLDRHHLCVSRFISIVAHLGVAVALC